MAKYFTSVMDCSCRSTNMLSQKSFLEVIYSILSFHIWGKKKKRNWPKSNQKKPLRTSGLNLSKVIWPLEAGSKNHARFLTLGLGTFKCTTLSFRPESQSILCPFSSYWETNKSENCTSESFIELVKLKFISSLVTMWPFPNSILWT